MLLNDACFAFQKLTLVRWLTETSAYLRGSPHDGTEAGVIESIKICQAVA